MPRARCWWCGNGNKILFNADNLRHGMKTRFKPKAFTQVRPGAVPSRRSRTNRLKRILVPVDFSADSRKAFAYATQLAERHDAKVSLVHVVEPILFEADYGYGPVVRHVADRQAINHAQRRLNRLGKATVGARRLGECTVRSGIAFFEITEAARLAGADLIIMGSHGHTGFAQPDVGGTTEKVVRHASCPVLVVHRKEPEFNV
jgi:nucleotide-binding universal stress UspA family protein